MTSIGSLNTSIESFATHIQTSLDTVTEFNTEFDSLIEKMEAEEANDLNEIIKTLREIAVDYKYLELKTRTMVTRTHIVISNVALIAGEKTLTPSEKLEMIQGKFAELNGGFGSLSKSHLGISAQLGQQAKKAEDAKERNDCRVEKAEEMKKIAKVCALLGTPVVGMVVAMDACAKEVANFVDNRALKVLADSGFAVLGIIGGAGHILTCPIWLTVAAVLAIKSKKWSVKFEAMHDSIRDLENIMKEAAWYLTNINESLKSLKNDVDNADPNKDINVLRCEFKFIQDTCNQITTSCKDYRKLLDSKTKPLKQINKPKTK